MKQQNKIENVVIIGGGPAGLSAGIYLARAGLTPLIFAGSPPGGQLTLTSEVENFPGHESILGSELIEKMRKQVEKFGAVLRDENVLSVEISNQSKSVQIGTNESILAKSIIIATGAKALWLGVPGEEKLRGKGVSACATCDGFFFRNKIVAVVGGGDTALEEALTLTKFASKVYVIHRRDSFRASKIMAERVLSHSKIEVIWNAQVVEIMGEKKVDGIKLRAVGTPSSTATYRTIQLDGLFVAIGHKPDTDLFKNKVALDDKGYIITSQRLGLEFAKLKSPMSNGKSSTQNLTIEELLKTFNLHFQTSTSIQGVFAAGDCVDYVYRQAGTAAGMGIAASLDVERWLETAI